MPFVARAVAFFLFSQPYPLMPYDKSVHYPLSDFWAEQMEQFCSTFSPTSLLPQIEAQPQREPEPLPFVHGELYTVSSGKTYRWVTNYPNHPEGGFIDPEKEWRSGNYV